MKGSMRSKNAVADDQRLSFALMMTLGLFPIILIAILMVQATGKGL